MKSALFVLVVVAYVATSDALRCYQCNNPPDEACGRDFNKNGQGVKTEECGPNPTCFLKIVEFESGNHTTRGCAVSLTNIDQRLGLVREHVHFCDTDLCNGATSMTAALSTLMTLVTVFIFGSHN